MENIYFGKNLKHLLDISGIDRESLANSIGVKVNTISNYINEKSFPQFKTVIDIVKLFDISLNEMTFLDIKKEGLSGYKNYNNKKETAENENSKEPSLVYDKNKKIKTLENEIRLLKQIIESKGKALEAKEEIINLLKKQIK